MKLLLSLIAVLFISSVSAQENQLFSAEEYLKKKRTESDRSIENPLLKKRPFVLPLPDSQAPFSYSLYNGNTVYILPQDNMPCVVPDMSASNYNMPNASTGNSSGVMPNPGLRNKPLIPGSKQ